MRKTLTLFILVFFSYCSSIFPQTPIVQIYGVQLLTSLDEIKDTFYSLELVVNHDLTPVLKGQRMSSEPFLSLEFLDINMGSKDAKSYKLTGVTRVEYQRSLDIWSAVISTYVTEIGIQPDIIENYPLKMAVWRFPETNTILNVSYNYQAQLVIERLNWDLSSITK